MGAHNYSPEFVTAQVERYSWAVSAQPLNASDCSKRHEVEVRNLEFWRQQQRGRLVTC